MSLEKIGRSLLFIIFILMIFKGTQMALKLGDPFIRKYSTSLADALAC